MAWKRRKTSVTTEKITSWKKSFLQYVGITKKKIHFELLHSNATINGEIYCQQLQHFNQTLKEKRPALMNRKRVMFHQDNSRTKCRRTWLGKNSLSILFS